LRYLEQNSQAASLSLKPEELEKLNNLVPAVGARY